MNLINIKQRKNDQFEIHLISKNIFSKINNRFNSLIDGTNLTKDLVSEPGNILHPDEYKKIITIKKLV